MNLTLDNRVNYRHTKMLLNRFKFKRALRPLASWFMIQGTDRA